LKPTANIGQLSVSQEAYQKFVEMKMKSPIVIVLLAFALCMCPSLASVFLPHDVSSRATTSRSGIRHMGIGSSRPRRDNNRLISSHRSKSSSTAMAIPGYGLAEQVIVGGFGNFLSIFNLIITARILLSWVPQAQSIGALQPLYQITDPYLNLFRGIIPSIGGLDLSPLAAFFLLNVLTNATAAVGSELTPEMKKKLKDSKRFMALPMVGKGKLNLYK
jgi:YggT family protein